MTEVFGDTENSEKEEGRDYSSQLAQIFLLVIPLISALVAFYFNSQQAESYSLGLEFLIIGILVIEFLLVALIKSGVLDYKGIYSDDPDIERFEANLICKKCNEELRFFLRANSSKKVECYECGNISEIKINEDYDGIVQIETPSP